MLFVSDFEVSTCGKQVGYTVSTLLNRFAQQDLPRSNNHGSGKWLVSE